MPEARPVPKGVCEKWIALLARTDMSLGQASQLIADEFPELFPQSIKPQSVAERLRRASQGHELEVPRKKRFVPKPRLRYAHEIPELVFDFEPRLIIISDLHASGHNHKLVDMARRVIETNEITAAVFNGDQLDNAYKGHKGVRSRFSAPFEENVEQFIQIANALKGAGLERQFVVQGNHDDKPLRESDGEMTYPMWWASVVQDGLDDPHTYRVTHRYYCVMRPEIPAEWPFNEGYRNFPWRFTHQKEYGRNPLGVAKRLATKYMMNMCCGHQHHLATGWHESGMFKVADAGTFQETSAAGYKVNRDSTHPEWNPGFLTLINNQVQIHEIG